MSANPNPDMQIQYSIQIFVKLYLDLDCIYGFKIKLYLCEKFVKYLDFTYGLYMYLDLDLDLLVVDLCPSLDEIALMKQCL